MSRGDKESRFWRLNCGMGRQGRNKEMEVEVEDEVEVDAEVGLVIGGGSAREMQVGRGVWARSGKVASVDNMLVCPFRSA